MTTYIYDMAATWTASGTAYNAIKMNVTDTASAAASLLLDLQVGATSKYKVGKDGSVTQKGKLTIDAGQDALDLGAGAYPKITGQGAIILTNSAGSTDYMLFAAGGTGGARVLAGASFGWDSATTNIGISPDTLLMRPAAGIVAVRGASSSAGAAINFLEQTAPSAPSADQVVLYAQDNGSGKTQLMARFSSGAAQQVAIQP